MAIESKMKGPFIGRGQEPKKKGKLNFLLIIIIVVVVLGGGWYLISNQGSSTDILADLEGDSTVEAISSGEYQAVFLDSGQVYFGRLTNQQGDFYQLTDIYYMRTGADPIDQAVDVGLVKLGGEVHGPEDAMEINKAHILFIEDLRSDSKVVKAIQNFKSSN